MFRWRGFFLAPRYTTREVIIPTSVYTVTAMRGSGPGGQGVNRSSNKAEVRMAINRNQPLPGIEEDVWENFLSQQGKHINRDNELIVTSHEHRSLQANINECLDKIRKMVVDASDIYIPPPPVNRELPAHKKDEVIRRKRISGTKYKSAILKGL